MREEINLEEFIGYHVLAKAPEDRGRPVGGLSVYVKKSLPKFHVAASDEHHIILSNADMEVALFYLQPEFEALEVLDMVHNALSRMNSNKPAIVAGDFNSRIDRAAKSRKGRLLVESLEAVGLTLVNEAEIFTYVCSTGRSTIDLCFTNDAVQAKLCSIWNNPSRKHLPVHIELESRGIQRSRTSQRERRYSRRIRCRPMKNKREQETLDTLTKKGDPDAAEAAIVNFVSLGLREAKRKKSTKRWFTKECRQLLSRVKGTLKKLRFGFQDAAEDYRRVRREYHAAIKASKLRVALEEEQRMVSRAEEEPYRYIIKKKSGSICNAAPEAIKEHFEKLLFVPEASTPEANVELPLNFDEWMINVPWTPLEVQEIIKSLPNSKSAGPDGLYYEHWKETENVTLEPIAQLFNNIMQEGRIPSSWHRARLTLLFKGRPSDSKSNMDLFRGIASEPTLKKIFFKGVIRRIEYLIEDHMPPQQFGFRRHMGTRDALHVVMSEIERSLSSAEGRTYAILIDCQKAFDLAPRQGMVNAFKRAGVNGQMLKVIESFYHEDSLKVSVGGGIDVNIQQNRGTPQGDPLSCTGFSLLLAELPPKVTGEFRTGTIAMFADDVIIMHRNRQQLQKMLDIVSDHLEEAGLRLNAAKTVVMKIRRGGRLSKHDRIAWKGRPLEFVSSAKYLGIRLQTTGICFTEHIEEVCCKTVATMYGGAGDPYHLAVATAVKLFLIKALPKLSYGMDRVWKHLSLKNFMEFEKCFCAYLKRTFRLHKSARNRYLYVIADMETPFVEIMRTRLKAENTPAFLELVEQWKIKVNEVRLKLEGDPILGRRATWSAAMYTRRHIFARYIVHGYHHCLCSGDNCHIPKDSCTCKYCGQRCTQYHAIMCETRPGLDKLGGT